MEMGRFIVVQFKHLLFCKRYKIRKLECLQFKYSWKSANQNSLNSKEHGKYRKVEGYRKRDRKPSCSFSDKDVFAKDTIGIEYLYISIQPNIDSRVQIIIEKLVSARFL